MLYGTVATMRVKPGKEQSVQEQFDRWWDERRSKVKGAISSTLYKSDGNPNEMTLAVVFDSKESYVANANDPEQDKWYRDMVQMLDGEPRWTDGTIVAHKHV